jgi:general secretion pathway protein D
VFRAVNLIKKFSYFSLVLTLPLFFQSCSGERVDPFDLDTGITRQEAFDTVLKKNPTKSKSSKNDASKIPNEVPIPKMSKLIVSPPPPVVGGDKVISFSVTDQVPLKDVLIEFGRMVQVDVDIDPTISGGIIINAKNRPLKEVVDRIATLGNLRYSYKDGVLHFESDTPYIKNYFVDYLTGSTLWTDVETNIFTVLAASKSGSAAATSASPSYFTFNKSAGIISVVATDRQHKAVASYLADVEKYSSAQVLIEAKVIEVNLSKSYSTGVDWSKSGDSDFGLNNGYAAGGALDVVLRTIGTTDLTVSITALEQFGTTKTISSPRIHAINNQKATLNFTDKLVYFQVQQTQSNTSTSGGDTALVASTISSTKLEESVGVILEIIPSINLKTNEITMSIKPKLSVLSDYVTDPASPDGVTDADGDVVVNQVPVIQSREIDTSVKIQSGNILVIGGLMKDESNNEDSGVPLLGRIPVLGWLFKSMSRSSGVTETVIFIKATIINSGTPTKKIDRDIQENFDPSKRVYFQ